MDYLGGSLEDFDLVGLGSTAPLRTGNIAAIEGEGIAATGGLPSQAILGEPAFAGLLREVKEDVVEVLA